MNFNVLLDKVSSNAYPDITIEQRDFFINLGTEKFITELYTGVNVYQKGYEQTQEITDKLSNLVVYEYIPPSGEGFIDYPGIKSYIFYLPEDYWFSLAEFIEIKPENCSVLIKEAVKRADHLSIGSRFKDPFNRPKYEKTFRTISNNSDRNSIQLYVDSTSGIGSYILVYLKEYLKLRALTEDILVYATNENYFFSPFFSYQTVQKEPLTITIKNVEYTLYHWDDVEFFMNKNTHQQIIDKAVSCALETLESPRIQTFNK